jgi:hypothetical protein
VLVAIMAEGIVMASITSKTMIFFILYI